MATAQDVCTLALGDILNDDATQTPAATDLNLALTKLIDVLDFLQLDPQSSLGLQEFVYTPALGTQSITIGLQISAVLTSTGTTATVTTTQNHGRIVGDVVVISGATQTEYNGSYTVVTAPTVTTFTYTFAGSATTPATGSPLIAANITTQAPPRVEESTFVRLGGVDFLMGFASSFEEYNINPMKTTQGYPYKCWYNQDTTSGIGRLYLYPASNGAEIHLWIRQVVLAGFSSMTMATTLTLPMGLKKVLCDMLAKELLDSYSVPDTAYGKIEKKANLSLKKWKRHNVQIRTLDMPAAIANRTANSYTC
jgi:hypothetical protein